MDDVRYATSETTPNTPTLYFKGYQNGRYWVLVVRQEMNDVKEVQKQPAGGKTPGTKVAPL